jgi:tetratricopeptide (TPR) repeat protein
VRRIGGDSEILLHRQTRTHVVFKQQESETISTVNTTTRKTMLRPLTITGLILLVVAGALGLYFWFIRPAPTRSASSASTVSGTGSKRWTENAEAYQAYLNGRDVWKKRTSDNSVKAAEYFQRAIELDPNFALAYVGLADAYNYFPLRRDQKATLARAALEKALALDDSLAEAHATLANLSLFDDWDWPEAERRFRRSIELDPNYPTAHHWYAYYLAAMGRIDEALAEIRRAQELDPLSLIINADVGQILHFARRDDEAIEQLRRTIEMDRGFVMAHHRLAEVYERTGKFDEALAEFQKAYPEYQTELPQMATVARVYALSGNQSEARRILARIARAPKGERDMVLKPSMALIHAGLGEREQAFAWLEKALAEKDVELILLNSNPLFDSLRPDPRFQTILRRMKLS